MAEPTTSRPSRPLPAPVRPERAPAHGRRSWLRQPTTILAAIVLIGSVVAAVVLSSGGSSGSRAATVGTSHISDATVAREVAAIEARPEYSSALQDASTLALAAPVSPQAQASANGDPDDLRISLAPVGSNTQRSYTRADLQAAVLTRLLYVSSVRELLAARHTEPTATEVTEGRQQARYESGEDAAGQSLFDQLPGWYQDELAERGADVEALERTMVGTGGITEAQVEAAYQQREATDFTTVCLRSVVLPSPAAGQPARQPTTLLGPGATGVRDDGCAPLGDWATDVQGAIRAVPAGSDAQPLARPGKVAYLQVTRRTVQPLSAVEGNVRAVLTSRYTDAVNSVVEDELALSHVTVSAQYGTYESEGLVHGVIPPDALTPPSPSGSGSTTPARSGPQEPDPFD